jgi:hypothetical protein
MKLNLSVNDLFNHMLVLGLAQIVEEEMPEAGHATVCWPDPQTAEIGWLNGEDLSIGEAAEAVWDFKEKILSYVGPNGDGTAIDGTIQIRGAKKARDCSPLSPRIANKPDFTEAVWHSYFGTRNKILDSMDEVSPLFVKLARALGFPAYWSEISGISTRRDDVRLSVSLWDMTPTNGGGEFYSRKYFKLLTTRMRSLTREDIAERIQGDRLDIQNSSQSAEYAAGLHRPASTDGCLSWIAYHGIALFPARPVTNGSCVSVTLGVIDKGRKQEFVLPIPDKPVTLGRYAAVSRYDGLYVLAAELQTNQNAGNLMAQDVAWLVAHNVTHIITFKRFKDTSGKNPEYYALGGHVFTIERGNR